MKAEVKNETPTTAMVVAQTNSMTALQICEHKAQIDALGQMLAQSGFFGRVSASTATTALVNCFLEGLTPLQYKAKYHTFDNGQTGIKSDFIQREFHRLGGKWKFNEWTEDVCDMTFTYQGEALNFRVTIGEFKKNGVAMTGLEMKDNWKKFPREMLKARCMATAIRAICPEACGGMYTQEEVADFAAPSAAPHYTPATVVATVKSVSPSPTADVVEPVDYGVCPCGSVKGKRWEDLSSDKLEAILATPEDKAKALTAEHRNAIVAELGRREVAEAGEVVIEPEVVEG